VQPFVDALQVPNRLSSASHGANRRGTTKDSPQATNSCPWLLAVTPVCKGVAISAQISQHHRPPGSEG
jgi:hypothetical protein